MPRQRRRRGLVGSADLSLSTDDVVAESSDYTPTITEPPSPSYSEADVPATAAEAIAWMDAASSDEDHIARAEALAAVNAGRRKPWASVSKATAEVLGA